MQKLASALLAVSVLSSTGLASAQTQPQTAPNPAASSATAAPQTAPQAAPQTAPGTAAGQPNFGELISSLNNMRAEIGKVQSMNGGSANDIRPVNVAQLSGADSSALSAAVSKNQSQIAALRNALNRVTVTTATNERISVAQFLADNKITLSQIVGADVSGGKLILFYQK